MLLSQYKPLLSTSTEWASELHGFAEHVHVALESLTGGFEWKGSFANDDEEPFLDLTNSFRRDQGTTILLEQALDKDPALMQRLEGILEEWCNGIEKYLSSTASSSSLLSEASPSINLDRGELVVMKDLGGPKGELDFWRNKMHRLNSVSEHFQNTKCRELIGMLMDVSKVKGGRIISKTRIPELLNRWTNLDNLVTMSSTETKDNIKYLSSMQRFVGPFYSGTVKGMIDAIPALMNSVKVSLHFWAMISFYRWTSTLDPNDLFC